jgi:predicted Rossmann-fold nucleotide-binding protein
MRCAVIYRPSSPPPPDLMPELMQRLGAWMSEYGSSMSTTEFFVGGGGFGVIDAANSSELQRMVAAHPFTPYSDVEIRPVVPPQEAMQILQEVFAQAAAG